MTTQPVDTGAIVLSCMGLGCFVRPVHLDSPRRERPVVYDSLRYLQAFWLAREIEFGLSFDELVDTVTRAQSTQNRH